MSKRREERILDEVRMRVIERDREKQEQRDESELRKANVEALIELTSLSREEILKIENQVRIEEKLKIARRNKYIGWAVVAFIVIAFLTFRVATHKSYKVHFLETFLNNQNNWDIYNELKSRQYFEKGNYIHEVDNSGWCYDDAIDVALPANYSVEIKSIWNSGSYGYYGIELVQDDDSYCVFDLKADGTVCFAMHTQKNWKVHEYNKDASVLKGNGERANLSKVVVNNNKYDFYVNDVLVKSGNIGDLKIQKVGLRTCDVQKVAFDYIKVTDLASKKVLFFDDFTTPNKSWTPNEIITKVSKIDQGKYYFSTNRDDYCYWSVLSMKKLSDKFEIKADCQWITGELGHYGIILSESDDRYFSFELTQPGKARIVYHSDGKYIYTQNEMETGFLSNGSNSQKLRIRVVDDALEYWVNDKKIGEYRTHGIKPLNVGFRVCGKQTVAFDNLSVDDL